MDDILSRQDCLRQDGSLGSKRALQDVFSKRQAAVIGGTHALALAALALPSRAGVAAFVVTYLLTGLGISLGYHRYLAHGAFRMTPALRAVLYVLGALALQGGPITWVSFHRAHHLFDDGPGDPHAASRGAWWSHMGWAFHKAPNGYRRQKLRRLTASLERNTFLAWLERHHLDINLALFAATWALFGASVALWAFPLRTVALWHVTWATNSVAHGAGGSTSAPRNVTWLTFLGFGEGLHENHHREPSSARFSRRAGDFDLGFAVLRGLILLRLARLPLRRVA
jgi:stearoyl-CoA desaturase (delta-9 desaturase)